ncbi:unnamed protein product [Ambrosiozyma monospora]|uniref:Unnamed protein product n=1 Tax=Ambrosiozyma monospora TaxID=43982 RepID=A0ACB5T765_AMBMO|nr:unnamed protein product [Ambrosiozyma monospora]
MKNGKRVFDKSSLDDANTLSTYIQYRSFIDDSLPISRKLSQLPDDVQFNQYHFYRTNVDDSELGHTVIPPRRFSFTLSCTIPLDQDQTNAIEIPHDSKLFSIDKDSENSKSNVMLPSFHDWRETVSVYYFIYLPSGGNLNSKSVWFSLIPVR